ncbi:DUF2057 family protein [Hahella ganghwensis]|uniref:DUF2057 family protein n=1 Tax=Hahella ganghwensis TaxID=286420 RepID=UPI0003731855|nr:DUF2057 family protein [Hahella ganghwensis]
MSLLMMAVVLSACTASSRVVKTYEGDTLDKSQVAKLVTPEDVDIVEIDGVKQKEYLLESMSLTYDLLPGEHVVVFKYNGLFSKVRESDDADAPRAELVQSDLRQARFSASAGQTYTFNFKRPENKAAAEVFAKTFQAVIVNNDGRSVAKDSKYVKPAVVASKPAAAQAPAVTAFPVAPSVQTATGTSAPAVQAASVAPSAPLDAGLSRLDALKVLWGKASAEEKKEFLRWAFQ